MPDTTQHPTPPPEDQSPENAVVAESWDLPVEPADPFEAAPAAEVAAETAQRYVVTTTWAGRQEPDWSEPQATATATATATAPKPRRSRGGFWKAVGIVLVSAIVGAASAAGVFLLMDDDEPVAATEPVIEILSPTETGSTAAAVARRVLPSIVTVQVRSSDVGAFIADGSGSGVVLTVDGLLITNHHVIEGALQVRVVFANGRTYDAEIVGADPLTDIAVLQIQAEGLTAVELGNTQAMHIGDTAIAIGSPLGLEGGPSVTVGVVSAFERRVQTSIDEELFGMLQTDAPITRGSSGGALVDDSGRLIGITTAIGISDVGAEGLGFAIPIELVRRISDDIIEFGEARHAFLGVTGSTFFTEAQDGATIPAGVAVASVFEETAAQLAGIEAGDVIMSVNAAPVTTMEQLVTVVRLFKVDESIDIVVDREGEEMTIPVTLLERPEGV